jgi:uncharacterized membrane protein YdjX (TVP38/TMEM64 family)
MTIAQETRTPAGWRRHAPLAAVALGLALFFALRLDRYLTLERLVESHAAARQTIAGHRLASFAAFVGLYAALVAISAPGATILTIAAGAIFGFGTGFCAGVAGATLGACILFLAARSAFGDWLVARAGPRLCRLRENFCADAPGYMLFLRLSPLFPFWFVNLAAAFAGVRLRTFLWTTLLGIMPATLVFAGAGAGLDRIASAAETARQACRAAGGTDCRISVPLSAIVTPQIIAVMIGLSLLALTPVLARKWRARASAPEAN